MNFLCFTDSVILLGNPFIIFPGMNAFEVFP